MSTLFLFLHFFVDYRGMQFHIFVQLGNCMMLCPTTSEDNMIIFYLFIHCSLVCMISCWLIATKFSG